MGKRVRYDFNDRRMGCRLSSTRVQCQASCQSACIPRVRMVSDVRNAAVRSRKSVLRSPMLQKSRKAQAANQRRNSVIARRLTRSAKILYMLENIEVARPKRGKRQSGALRKVKKKIVTWQFFSRSMAIALTVFALYAVADTLILNQKIEKERSDTVAAAQSDDSNKRQAAEGKDEKDVSDDVIARYKVAPELPRIIHINAIGVKARVLQMGVNADGSMQAPINVFDTGWYTGSVRPGQKGASIIVGHVSGPTRHGIFEKLSQLKNGDSITIENGAGKSFNYQVVASETVKLENVDMDKFMHPANGVDEGLNLMTCAGKWINNGSTMDHRLMVYAKRTS